MVDRKRSNSEEPGIEKMNWPFPAGEVAGIADTRVFKPSKALAVVIGDETMQRTEVIARVWRYIKSNELQDPEEPRFINADEKLRVVFGTDRTSMFEMTGHISRHLKPVRAKEGTSIRTRLLPNESPNSVDLPDEQSLESDEAALDEKVARLRKHIRLEVVPLGYANPTRVAATTSTFLRSPSVKAWVLEQAAGTCESCKQPAPFIAADGSRFLEVHHVRTLANGGSDRVENAVALCPNCHRRAHVGRDKEEIVKSLFQTIPRLRRE